MSIPYHRPSAHARHIPVQYESASPLTPSVSRAEAVAAGRRALQAPPMHADSISLSSANTASKNVKNRQA